MNPNNLNLYVVDDDEGVRRSLGSLFLAQLEDCSIKTFESGESFLEKANLNGSGVVVLDYIMGGMTGLEVHQRLVDLRSPLVVVFLSGKGDIPDAVRAMMKGAVCWLQKPCTDEELFQTVEVARQKAKEIAIDRRDRYDGLLKWRKLTLREMQVCALAAGGKSARESEQILDRLHPDFPINYRTIENHRGKAFAKLDVNNSNALLIFLQQNGLWDEAQASVSKSPGDKE